MWKRNLTSWFEISTMRQKQLVVIMVCLLVLNGTLYGWGIATSGYYGVYPGFRGDIDVWRIQNAIPANDQDLWVQVRFRATGGIARLADANEYDPNDWSPYFVPLGTSQSILVHFEIPLECAWVYHLTLDVRDFVYDSNAPGGIRFGIWYTNNVVVGVSPPNIEVQDTALVEGNDLNRPMEFAFRLSTPIGYRVTVDYLTEDMTATAADNDYQTTSGTLVFEPNQIVNTVTVPIYGDTIRELDERFRIRLSNPINALLTTDFVIGEILNDDCNGPGFPYNPIPPHIASTVGLNPTLEWSCLHPQGKELRYNLFFGDFDWPIARLIAGLSSPSYKLPTLSSGRTYAWRIVATDGENITEGPKWFFKTQGHDLNDDGIVNLIDFAILAQDYLVVVPTESNLPEMEMVLITGGEFEMGDSKNEVKPDASPVHTVTLDSFAIGKFEVTNEQYCQYLNSALGSSIYVSGGVVYGSENDQPYCDTSTRSSWSMIAFSNNTFTVLTKGYRDMSNDPMVMVSWYGAAAYCNWRSQREGKEICYNASDPDWACDPNKHGYRLPTEAEWEYAARGGLADNRFPWGDMITDSQANYSFPPLWNDGIFPYTSPVGFYDGSLRIQIDFNWMGGQRSYQTTSGANGYGLYDMSGNVWELCNDWYSSTYYGSSPHDNPTGPASGIWRVIRGGCWAGNEIYCLCCYRHSMGAPPSDRSSGHVIGFRVVLDLE